MQVTVSAGELAGALKTINPAVAGKTTLPILQHVLLDARDGLLTLSATDLEIALQTSIPATVQTVGRITASAKSLDGWVSVQLGRDEIELKADPKNLHLKCRRNRSRLSVADPDDMPPLPAIGLATYLVDADPLAKALTLVLPSVAKDQNRPVLAGLCLDFKEATLSLAGTDGLRLGLTTLPQLATESEPSTLIVPGSSMAALAKLLAAGGDVAISVSPGHAAFHLGLTSLYSRLIAGQFPDYQRIIPTEAATTVTVSVAALELQVRAAHIAGREAPVRFKTDGGPSLTIWSRETDVEHEGQIDAEVNGASVEVALRADQVLSALGAMGTETVELRFQQVASSHPVVFCEPGKSADALQLLMSLYVRADNTALRTGEREAVSV